MKVSIGVDLHKSQFTVCFREEWGKQVCQKYFTGESEYKRFVRDIAKYSEGGHEPRIAVESTGNTRFFKNRLEREGIPVVVINTLKFKVINESVKKTDRHDAGVLAEFLEKDMLPEARLCSEKSEAIRRVLKSRQVLVRTIVTVKNQIHSLLLGYGIESPRSSLQSQKKRRNLYTVLEEQKISGDVVKPLFEIIESCTEQVKNLEKLLEDMVKDDENVRILRTIPGAGLITAATIRAYTDDINRYFGYKQFSSYCGLAPWVQDSNETIRHGRITKRGPEPLRTALVQLVLGMVRSKRTANYRIIERYKSMKSHKGSGKSIIATARKLSKIIWYMLKNKTDFDPSRMMDHGLKMIALEMASSVA